jgi:hypothetical protein
VSVELDGDGDADVHASLSGGRRRTAVAVDDHVNVNGGTRSSRIAARPRTR